MTINLRDFDLDDIDNDVIPPAALRQALAPYGGQLDHQLKDAITPYVTRAYANMLRPAAGTIAAQLADAFDGRVDVMPLVTIHGAVLTSITRAQRPSMGGGRYGENRPLHCLVFDYDDGLRKTVWADFGDHGATLVVDSNGLPAFYTVMTSDAYYDARCSAGHVDLSFTIVDRLHELDDRHLAELVGDVDVRRLNALPRRDVSRANTTPAHPNMSLRTLYAAPPTPAGRARLGRR